MLLPILAMASLPKQEVAVVARIYYPPGDSRVSRHEVYVCDLNGKHLRKISNMKDDVDQVRWKDRTHMVWDTYEGESDKRHWWQYDTATRKVREVTAQRGFEPNDPILLRDEGDDLTSSDLSHPAKIDLDERGRGYTMTWGSRSKLFELPDPVCGLQLDRASNRAWIQTTTHDSTTGTHQHLYVVDWNTGKAVLKLGDFEEVDFSVSRGLYVAVEPRDTEAQGENYGKGHSVWTARAWAGDWKTGKKWVILGGLVWAKSISLRPAK